MSTRRRWLTGYSYVTLEAGYAFPLDIKLIMGDASFSGYSSGIQ